jgi:hypothetical protein
MYTDSYGYCRQTLQSDSSCGSLLLLLYRDLLQSAVRLLLLLLLLQPVAPDACSP